MNLWDVLKRGLNRGKGLLDKCMAADEAHYKAQGWTCSEQGQWRMPDGSDSFFDGPGSMQSVLSRLPKVCEEAGMDFEEAKKVLEFFLADEGKKD